LVGHQSAEQAVGANASARREQVPTAKCRSGEPQSGGGMSISGAITSRDVLRNSATIVRQFGARTYLRCCLAMLLGRQTTFLNCVF
jgi:hypothetical protein